MSDTDELRAQLGAMLRRWGLLDEVNDPAATEAFVVTDLMAVLREPLAPQVLGTPATDPAPASAPATPADRYRAAWLTARHRTNVLSAELTRRAPLLGEYAAEIERLRVERTELIRQRDQIAMDTIKALPAPADRAAVLREAADVVEHLPVPNTRPGWALGAAWALAQIRRLADDTEERTP